MPDTETDTYHYAACHDCPLYKWVGSDKEAETAAERHHRQRGHQATWGRVLPHTIEGRNTPPEGDYNE